MVQNGLSCFFFKKKKNSFENGARVPVLKWEFEPFLTKTALIIAVFIKTAQTNQNGSNLLKIKWLKIIFFF
jgi:hypothetical protein